MTQLQFLSDPSRNSVGKHQRPGDAAETQILSALEAYPASGTQRRAVLIFITDLGGATDEEVQLGLGMNPSTQRPRRVELVEGGWIEDSGERRKTRSGRNAVVWTLTPTESNTSVTKSGAGTPPPLTESASQRRKGDT